MVIEDASAVPDEIAFEVVLIPHRSLPPQGFFVLMLIVAGVSFVTGVTFVMLGAWPVTGFFGLDVLLLYVAFRMSYRSARTRETLRLTGDDFMVERISVRGERRIWRFHPYWLRVTLDEVNEDANRLLLSSHGRSLAIAGFLNAAERRALATDLRQALAAYKAGGAAQSA